MPALISSSQARFLSRSLNTPALSNLRVLVTRPQHQAQGFIKGIEERGGVAFHLPTIEIVFASKEPVLTDADLIIFTSVNAVIGAQLRTGGLRNSPPLLAAIGTATANSLHKAGYTKILAPTQNGNSESLVDLLAPIIVPEMKVIIVRGDSGRDTLRDSLQQLGARVRYEQVYERTLPSGSDSAKTPEELWQLANPDIVSVSSDLGLDNLITLLPGRVHPQLFNKPLVANSERCMHRARDAGFSAAIAVANPPGDEGQINQLINYVQSKRQNFC